MRLIQTSFCAILLALSLGSAYAQVKHGRIDLRNQSLDGHRYTLSGEWEFYWNRLLFPADFKTDQKPEWIPVPGSWHRYSNHPPLGYATYRLNLILPSRQNGLALLLPVINSSAKVWVNGVLVNETGKVDSIEADYAPQLKSTLVSIPENTSHVEIVLQVANFTYFSGGIAAYPVLAKSDAIFAEVNGRNGVENFFAGSLIALFIYQLILYFLYHRGKPFLWLALICLGVALRALIVHGGSFLLPNLFPTVEWEIWKKIEFGSVYAITALFPLYVYHLFTGSSPRKPIWFFVGTAGVLCAAVLATPQYIYGQLLEVCHVALLLSFIYAVYSISKAWRAGNDDARIILFGVLASFPFILLEILKNSRLFPVNIQFMYLVELGVLVFLLFQVYLLANHYAKSYRNLETVNQDLERMVSERTGELVTANTVKNRLLSVISHDIKSPLNSLRGILQLYNKGALSKDEFGYFTQQIEGELGKTNMLVENILFWTASQLKGVQVNREKLDVTQRVVENMELFQTIARNKKIRLSHDVPGQLIVNFDRNILNLLLRNLLSNAIKFSYEGGEVRIEVRSSGGSLLLQVKDQGVGMDDATLQELMDPKLTVSKTGTTEEKGTGLGLALCREFLQKAGGLLTVESRKGQGSTFTILLPA